MLLAMRRFGAGLALVLASWLACAGFAAPVRADDWGLTRPGAPEKKARPGPARPKPAAQPGQAAGPSPTEVSAKASATQRERYLRLLLANPDDSASALQRLFALYRERDGNLDGLARELSEMQGQAGASVGAALLLGKVELERGQRESARAAFERAAALAPHALAPVLARAELARAQGDLAAADALLGAQLPKVTERRARAELLRELGELAIERKDYAAAEQHYGARAKALGNGVFESTELARALAAKGEHARAADAYARAIDSLRGDPRVLAPLWLERARAEIAAGQHDRAASSLARARALAGAGTGLRADSDELLLALHRDAGTLAQLAEQLAAERGGDQLALLGRVYEELGDQPRALAALRSALARAPSSTALRERVIRILTQRGDLRAAIDEYRVLVRHAPREPRFAIDLARALLESGARAEALRMLDATGQRFPGDARIARALLELYSSWGEHARATRMLEHLSKIEPNDPTHWVALGEQRLEQGDEAGALAAWRRIVEAGGDPAEAHAQLGATLLDHDMPERALEEYEAALKLAPDGLTPLRGSAETLERLQRLGEAAERWSRVLALTTDKSLRREARRRVVRLWAATGDLTRKRAELERAFLSAKDPDVEAGRFLAESYRALATGRRRALGDVQLLAEAEKVLLRVAELAPGDSESLHALERVRVQRGDLAGAIAALERLLAADPKNAQSYLARMAEHALALYRDDEALGYAERAVQLAPSDAGAYLRLGNLYRARQNVERAIDAYEHAVALDPNAFATQLELAELHLAHDQLDAAGAGLRRVLRASPDDELVQRAARALLQLELRGGRLPEVEQTLLPLALGHPQRPVYREALVELYAALTRPLVQAVAEGGPDAEPALRELRALGQRAIKPLLETLADDDPAQQRIAIELLAHLRNEHAAAPLLSAAEREGDVPLRRQALLAAAATAGPALAPRFAALARAPERRLRDAAAYALASMRGPAAVKELRSLLGSNTAVVRGYALLGLGRNADPGSLSALREAAQSESDGFARGAALLALGMSGDRESVPLLATALRTERGEVAVAAALALGLIGDARGAEPLCDALFSVQPLLRHAALWSLRWLAKPRAQGLDAPALAPRGERALLEPELAAWLALEPEAPALDALMTFGPALHEAIEAAMRGSPLGTRSALNLLSGSEPLLGPREQALLRSLLSEMQPLSDELRAHADPQVRALALELLASPDAGARQQAALAAALDDRDERVQSAALDGLSDAAGELPPAARERIALLARSDPRWWMRRRAVAALARALGVEALPVAERALREDPYAYVREQAATSLGELAVDAAVPALSAAARSDAEPRVRAAAARALVRVGTPAATRALERLQGPAGATGRAVSGEN